MAQRPPRIPPTPKPLTRKKSRREKEELKAKLMKKGEANKESQHKDKRENKDKREKKERQEKKERRKKKLKQEKGLKKAKQRAKKVNKPKDQRVAPGTGGTAASGGGFILPQVVVETSSGKVAGVVDHEVRTWRGIPYGGDTSGKHRFSAPQPAPQWEGIRDCTTYGPVATQPTYGLNDNVRGSEDCLLLDIVRPDSNQKLPVVVYFHGGSFIYGSSHHPVLRGHELAKNMDVVYVSINFRLGALGYLDMRSFGDNCVANPAVLDQILALKWIKHNIAAFGGDPERITLMGESAGAAAVLTLMCVPSARGLFHRAIAQSAPLATIHSSAQATMWSKRLGQQLGLSDDATLEELRALDAADLVRAGQSMMWRSKALFHLNYCYGATVDNRTLFAHPLDVFAAGDQHKVPLLIGTNGDEAALLRGLYLRSSARGKAANRMVNAFDPEQAESVLRAYNQGISRQDFSHLLSDALFWTPTIMAAGAHARAADTWMYRFDFAPVILKMMGIKAMHAMELSPIFGDLQASRIATFNRIGAKGELEDLRGLMQFYWGNFIHTGNPNHGVAQPEEHYGYWPRYVQPDDTAPGRATMIFDDESKIVYDPRSSFRRAWSQYRMTEWGLGRSDLGLFEDIQDQTPLELPPGT